MIAVMVGLILREDVRLGGSSRVPRQAQFLRRNNFGKTPLFGRPAGQKQTQSDPIYGA
jgi:hypothetical protein